MGGGFNLDLLENRESHRSEFFISAQRDRSAVVCEFRMSAIEIKPSVLRFPSADLNRDNFVRIRRFRFKFRVRLGWTFERMRVKFQSARLFLTPCIDIKRFD